MTANVHTTGNNGSYGSRANVSTTWWCSTTKTTEDGHKFYFAHKTQVLYGQDLPCMSRIVWIDASTAEESQWAPCLECN